jgi:hypothetical protein
LRGWKNVALVITMAGFAASIFTKSELNTFERL